jgi:adenylate cyclase
LTRTLTHPNVPPFHLLAFHPLRFLPIAYGTERYPEKIALRLRAVNITALFGTLITGTFAVIRLFDPLPGRGMIALVHGVTALAFASIPLLHRVSPIAGPLAVIAVSYAYIFWVISVLGTAGGSYLFYLIAAALGILFLGIERAMLAAVLSVAAIALIITAHVVLPLDTGFASPSTLFYVNFVPNVVASAVMLFVIVYYAVRQIGRAEEAAERQYERAEMMLENILPAAIAARLKSGEPVIADRYDAASVLFADMAGFTSHAADLSPDELVVFLNTTFTTLDTLVERHGLEKIKTTGDAYMVVSGVPTPRSDHAAALANLAIDMRDRLIGLVDPKGRPMMIRIGLATGPVVAGVVGRRKFFYDVWGDTVNLASRMESTGEPGRIQVTSEMHALLRDCFELEERGHIEVKGRGEMHTWFLRGRK